MNRMRNIIIISLFFCISPVFAQEKDTVFWNKRMLDIAHKGEHKGWVDIKEDQRFSKNDFWVRNKEAFRLTSHDGMRHISFTTKDELSYKENNSNKIERRFL